MPVSDSDRQLLAGLCAANRISRLVLFGSVARGEDSPSSDIDLIAELPPDATLLDMVRLQREFSLALGRPVDLLTEESISPYIMENIGDDVLLLYETN